MQYRKLTIKPFTIEYPNIGKRENSPITTIKEKSGYTCPQIGKGCIGETIKETKETIDNLINEVIRCCNTTETQAIKLIRETK